MNEYLHIHEEYRHLMRLSDQERIDYLAEPRWLGYDVATSTMKRLQRVLKQPRQPRMNNLLIVGDSNNGKTTIIRRFVDNFGKPYIDENVDPIKPIILAESSEPNEKGLYLSILDRFHAPHRIGDPTSKLRWQVIHLFRACKVQMLIIDEFHALLEGKPAAQRATLNAIKFLCNELQIPIVGVGTRSAITALHSEPQHASRFDVLPLPRWELNKDFQRILASIEKVVPLKNASKLHQPENARPLHYICDGNLGNLMRLVRECAEMAITTGSEKIDKTIIEKNAWVRPTHGIRERAR